VKHIYIAGRYEAKERLKRQRAIIEYGGEVRVVGTWLDEENTGTPTPEQSKEYAIRDWGEIMWLADLLILDTFDEDDRGGREVEFGLMLGRGSQYVWIVGPQRNVFHHVAAQHFGTWASAYRAIQEWA
jgi:hypothetical protein